MPTLRDIRSFLSRHGFIAGVLVLFSVLSLQYTLKVTRAGDPRSAVLRWQNQVLDLWQGTDIWQKYNYPNPPIMALVLTPLMHLPPLTCSLMWFYLKALLAIAAVFWVFRMVETRDRPFPLAGKVLVLVLSIRPVAGDLTHGNVNLFILFLVVAALFAFTRGRDLASGILLGLAIACKLTPALFVPYFLWKRCWRTLAGCSIGLILFLGVVPAVFLGIQENSRYLQSWTKMMVRPFVVDGVVTSEHNNQSLPGLVYRLASHSPSFSEDHDAYVPREYHNLLDLDRQVLAWFLKGCMALFALGVMWSCRTPAESRTGWRLPAEFSIICLGMLLFSERTWKHHCVTLLLPFAVCIYHVLATHPPARPRRVITGALVLVGLLILSTGTSGSEAHQFGKMAQLYGAYVWAFVLLSVTIMGLLRIQAKSASYHIEQYRIPSGLTTGIAGEHGQCTSGSGEVCGIAGEVEALHDGKAS